MQSSLDSHGRLFGASSTRYFGRVRPFLTTMRLIIICRRFFTVSAGSTEGHFSMQLQVAPTLGRSVKRVSSISPWKFSFSKSFLYGSRFLCIRCWFAQRHISARIFSAGEARDVPDSSHRRLPRSTQSAIPIFQTPRCFTALVTRYCLWRFI